MVAHLRVAPGALGALSTPGHERHGHPIARPPVADLAADFKHNASKLMPRHMRQMLDIGIVPLPAMPIAATQPGRPNLNHRAIGRALWLWDVGDGERAAEAVEGDGLHGGSL